MPKTFPSTLGTLRLLNVILFSALLTNFVEGKFTEFTILPFSKKSINCETAITAQFSSASAVLAPM